MSEFDKKQPREGAVYAIHDPWDNTVTGYIKTMLPGGTAARSETARACRWQQDADGIYQTGCGEAFFFDTGSAEENRAKFCQYCGGNLIVSNYKEET